MGSGKEPVRQTPIFQQNEKKLKETARAGRFFIDEAARDRWFRLMSAALDEAMLPAESDARLRAFLSETATFLINR